MRATSASRSRSAPSSSATLPCHAASCALASCCCAASAAARASCSCSCARSRATCASASAAQRRGGACASGRRCTALLASGRHRRAVCTCSSHTQCCPKTQRTLPLLAARAAQAQAGTAAASILCHGLLLSRQCSTGGGQRRLRARQLRLHGGQVLLCGGSLGAGLQRLQPAHGAPQLSIPLQVGSRKRGRGWQGWCHCSSSWWRRRGRSRRREGGRRRGRRWVLPGQRRGHAQRNQLSPQLPDLRGMKGRAGQGRGVGNSACSARTPQLRSPPRCALPLPCTLTSSGVRPRCSCKSASESKARSPPLTALRAKACCTSGGKCRLSSHCPTCGTAHAVTSPGGGAVAAVVAEPMPLNCLSQAAAAATEEARAGAAGAAPPLAGQTLGLGDDAPSPGRWQAPPSLSGVRPGR